MKLTGLYTGPDTWVFPPFDDTWKVEKYAPYCGAFAPVPAYRISGYDEELHPIITKLQKQLAKLRGGYEDNKETYLISIGSHPAVYTIQFYDGDLIFSPGDSFKLKK